MTGAIYFPQYRDMQTQPQVLERLEYVLDHLVGEDISMGDISMGDFDVILDPRYEHISAALSERQNTLYRHQLLYCLQNFSLIDVWRKHNPSKHIFTWYAGTRASRLDYIFMPQHLLTFVNDCGVRDISLPNHRFIYVSLGHRAFRRGPGFWKMKSHLLVCQGVAEGIVDLIRRIKVEYASMDPVLRWELLILTQN